MSDSDGIKDDCKCGHDRCHHYRDPSYHEYYNCLAVHCNCKWFAKESYTKERPAHFDRREP